MVLVKLLSSENFQLYCPHAFFLYTLYSFHTDSDVDVIANQDKWQSSNLPPSQLNLFTKLATMLDHCEITQCLDRAIAYSSTEVSNISEIYGKSHSTVFR